MHKPEAAPLLDEKELHLTYILDFHPDKYLDNDKDVLRHDDTPLFERIRQMGRLAIRSYPELEVLILCGEDKAEEVALIEDPYDRIMARSDAITNARYDRLLGEIDTAYNHAIYRLYELENAITRQAVTILPKSATRT